MVINKNLFVHSGISLQWAELPAFLSSHKEGRTSVDSLAYLNFHATYLMRRSLRDMLDPIFSNGNGYLNAGPLFYKEFSTPGTSIPGRSSICDELDEVLDIMDVRIIIINLFALYICVTFFC